MARANIFGTQPIATAQRRGGGGGGAPNRPRNPNRGGGGGGGGNRIPNTGLYGGRQGEALANQDPEKFIRDLLGHAGVTDFSGTPYGDWANDTLVQNLLDEYAQGQDITQRISPVDFFKQQYGAGFFGKKGKNFQAGTLSSARDPLAGQWTDYQSNTNPEEYLTNKGIAGGALLPTGGNSDFDAFYRDVFVPKIQAQLGAARANGYTPAGGGGGNAGGGPGLFGAPHVGSGGGFVGPNPQLSLDDFVAGRDLTNEARMAYRFRPNTQRLPGPISLAGGYSWGG